MSTLFLFTQLNIKTVHFKQFSLAYLLFSSIWPIDRTLPLWVRVDLGAMAMKGYSAFPEASASDCLMSYPGHSLEESYPTAEMQLVYSTAPADWAREGFVRLFGLMAHQLLIVMKCQALFEDTQIYMIFKGIVCWCKFIFKQVKMHVCTQLNYFKYCFLLFYHS